MGFQNVGKVWTPQTLIAELATLVPPNWCEGITLHHTGVPSLAQRPHGFKPEHLQNLRDYYAGKGWSAGPHLFVDEDQLWGMTPFEQQGVHAKAFNNRALGIEVLGNYDVEDPLSGRGLTCWANAAAAVRVLMTWLGKSITSGSITFHREDPGAHKSCPGSKVDKAWILGLIDERARVVVAEAPNEHMQI